MKKRIDPLINYMNELHTQLRQKLERHLTKIYDAQDYPTLEHRALAERLIQIMNLAEDYTTPSDLNQLWNEQDAMVICYGDNIQSKDEIPLHVLHGFFEKRLSGTIKSVHILPFFPYSSDDGFSVIDYTQVNDSLGGWQEIEKIADSFNLMSDLVINHCSSRSRWFDNFKQGKEPGKHYFIAVDPDTDTSAVVRPRTSPLLREVETLEGKKSVWCTFSHDQVDLNFSNPDLLCELVAIIKLYLDRGVKIFRLDAVAFIWKELGTVCIHHPKTHEIVRLIRTLIEHHPSNAIIITETNVPNHENLSYFGNVNEAHAVYNFSLPPLLINALITGSNHHLKTWQMSMPPAQLGTFYFNFIASHDGIGLRPAEGLLSEDEIDTLINTMQQFGARISWRAAEAGKNKAYEMNISLFDAFQGTTNGPDKWQIPRFICAHSIMMALEGIPAFYLNSLVATNNYEEGVELSKHNRTINRYKWNVDDLDQVLDDSGTHHAKVFNRLTELIRIRCQQPAFHPNATQFTLHLGDQIFGFWRQSINREQSIFCINNISDQKVSMALSSINLISMDNWFDLISNRNIQDLHEELVLEPYQSIWLTNKKLSGERV